MTVSVNDVHSRLNETRVDEVREVTTPEEVRRAVLEGRDRGGIAIAGGRHAMGGQQFLTDGLLLDTRPLDEVLAFDDERGTIRIGAGATWPRVIGAIRARGDRWGIRQKQTGADDLTVGGSISANVHGRGLGMGPIVEDVECLHLLDAQGELRVCSRDENPELFAAVVGGYGLFGVIIDATLRLAPRRRLRRIVDVIDLDDALNAAYRRFDQGCLYGDFQYAIDPSDDGFLRRGVMACYEPVGEDFEVSDASADLDREDWLALLRLAHLDKRAAFQRYSEHYLATHGRVYWSDTMQLSTYIPSYAEFLADVRAGEGPDESLMITELYVPPDRLPAFMAAARRVLRESGVEDIYGTIRSIRADDTTLLRWAVQDFACIVFNLRTEHSEEGVARTSRAARELIDAAADEGGSFFLTYHRWATRAQLLRCHPAIETFLATKLEHDPDEVFQSDWYRHVRDLIRG